MRSMPGFDVGAAGGARPHAALGNAHGVQGPVARVVDRLRLRTGGVGVVEVDLSGCHAAVPLEEAFGCPFAAERRGKRIDGVA